MFKGRIDFDKTPENIIKYIDTLGVKYHIYKKGDTKEYDYLDDNSFCITIENPYKRDEKMYLDLYNDEEEYIYLIISGIVIMVIFPIVLIIYLMILKVFWKIENVLLLQIVKKDGLLVA